MTKHDGGPLWMSLHGWSLALREPCLSLNLIFIEPMSYTGHLKPPAVLH